MWKEPARSFDGGELQMYTLKKTDWEKDGFRLKEQLNDGVFFFIDKHIPVSVFIFTEPTKQLEVQIYRQNY